LFLPPVRAKFRAVRLCGIAMMAGLCAACAGTPAPRPRTNVAPPRDSSETLAASLNQNAPPPEPEDFDPADLVPIVLWCSQDNGEGCTAAEQELGIASTPPDAIPAQLLERARDTDDDCNDPDVAPLMQRVTSALGLGSSWAEQVGSISTLELLSDPYTGSGCISRSPPGAPLVKIHVADTSDGARFLVRVWEVGDLPR